MTVTYTVGDTREVIKGIPDGSVDLIASSPPFLALRSYVPADHESKGDEIGSERNPAEFIDMLLGLTAEWGRVLAPHGSLAIELGDTYSGSGGAGGDYNEGGLRDGQNGFDGSAARTRIRTDGGQYGNHRGGGDKYNGDTRPVKGGGSSWPRAKSLALIPQLYAVALAYGINPLTGQPSPAGRWLVRNVIVWHRPNPAVGALGDKVRPSTSYIVVATRSLKRWFDLTAVRTASKDAAQAARPQHKPTHLSGREDLWDQAGGRFGIDPAGAPPLDAWFDQYDSEVAEATSYDGSHDTWTLTTQPSRLAHYAMWPAKLAERLILSMCPLAVCRVCGEPRRRVETSEYLPHGDIARQNGEARALQGMAERGVNGSAAQFANGRATKVPTTIGWTDCGCVCSRCEGTGRVPDRYSWELPHLPCPDCDGPQYRPGLVLDPFCGSGTTLAVADLHGRDAIGIDFDARNKAIYPARYDEVKKSLYGTPAPMPGQETFDFAI